MKQRLIYILLLGLVNVLILSNSRGQNLSGYVSDVRTAEPLQGAVLNIFDGNKTHFYETSLDGYYNFDLPPGIFTLFCSRRGYEEFFYEKIRLEYDQFFKLDIEMTPLQQKNLEPAIDSQNKPNVRNTEMLEQKSIKKDSDGDFIYTLDGKEIKVQIQEITQEFIKYRDFLHLSGPIRNIPIDQVFMVIYKDGSRETFNNRKLSSNQMQTESGRNHNSSNEYERKTNNNKDPNKERYYKLGVSAGIIIPTEAVIREIYGNIYSFGIDFEEHGYYKGNNVGVVARYEAEYYQKKGQPKVYGSFQLVDATAKITGIPLTGNIGIISRRNKARPYLLVGVGYYILKEELTVEYLNIYGNIASETISASANNIGFQLIFGNVVENFFAEVKYSKANLSTSTKETEHEIDFGGFRFSIGLRF